MTVKQTLKKLCPPRLWHIIKKIIPPFVLRMFKICKKNYMARRETAFLQHDDALVAQKAALINNDKRLNTTMQDGLLRMRITNRCNARCRYCGIRFWPPEVQKMDMPLKIMYEWCKPLYEQIKILLLTGGDPLITKESLSYCRFISEQYPHITLYLETNGVGFTEEWQELAMKNLMKIHISLNASCEEVYRDGCWDGEAGTNAYRKMREHISAYMNRLREKNLELFAPDISMVINRDTYYDITDFVRYALETGLHHCMFYFDYTENDMSGDYFGNPETSRRALFELMKLERVLAGKFFIYFRLWIPLRETAMMQNEVEAIPIETLRREYADILELAQNRSMKAEFEGRNIIRKAHGKKEFVFDEDWTPTIRQITVPTVGGGICFAPFKALDIYPNKKMECCSWITPRFNVCDEIQQGKIDWDAFYNSFGMKSLRYDMLNNDFKLCQKCCPLNPLYTEVCTSHKYGYLRNEA